MEKKGYCCFCHEKYGKYGNDIRPLISTLGNRCCDKCNALIVIPNRMKFWNAEYFWVIKDLKTGLFYDHSGLPNSAIKSLLSEYVIKATTIEEAEDIIDKLNLQNCLPIRFSVREDN